MPLCAAAVVPHTLIGAKCVLGNMACDVHVGILGIAKQLWLTHVVLQYRGQMWRPCKYHACKYSSTCMCAVDDLGMAQLATTQINADVGASSDTSESRAGAEPLII